MAATTGIGWTDGTCNYWIGCSHAGPGCEGCYAEVFADRKFNIKFGPGERRMRTKAGYENPLRWQRMHDRGQITMRENHQDVPVPRWVFCNSLSDFFDNEIPEEWRTDAWQVIRDCPALRWQIVTKRVGNVAKMLPHDWDGGRNYSHVGIIATMVNQEEIDRDMPKLLDLKFTGGVRWIGLSIEPQLGPITLMMQADDIYKRLSQWYGPNGFDETGSQPICERRPMIPRIDWCIVGGESKQGEHAARPFDLIWAEKLIKECASAEIPIFVKQMGDNPKFNREPFRKMRDSGSRPDDWPRDFRVQQMPRVFDADLPYEPKNLPTAKAAPDRTPTLL